MDIARLRRETAQDHSAVEGSMPLMHPDLDAAGYLRCLSRVYGVVAAWEEQARSAAPEWLRESLAARERRGLLDRDLDWFGSLASADRAALPPFNDPCRMLGAMYVMEGSTLGGQLIARHVEKCLGLATGMGDAFFVGHGDRTGRMWKDFCTMLETRVPDSETECVVLGAKAMFAAFGAWMHGIPASIDR